MANKVKLGNRPETFKKTVTFKFLDGSDGQIDCTFAYRTKTEFGQFIDAMSDDAGEDRPADEKFSMADLMTKTVGKNADYLLKALKEWDLDVPLNAETANQLCDELPAAATAILEAYRAATVEGRAGN